MRARLSHSLGATNFNRVLTFATLLFTDDVTGTSAVSSDMERMLYKICAAKEITCITISHRPALEAFHHTKLELDGHGTFLGYRSKLLHSNSTATLGSIRLGFTPVLLVYVLYFTTWYTC
jgi:hypothetical protein